MSRFANDKQAEAALKYAISMAFLEGGDNPLDTVDVDLSRAEVLVTSLALMRLGTTAGTPDVVATKALRLIERLTVAVERHTEPKE